MSTYTTLDSGERAEFDSGMQRDTEAGKPRFDLLVPEGIPFADQLLTRFAALMARGAEKYTERNWEQADSEAELARMRSSAFRHFMQWLCGETDEDHAAATMFNLMAHEATAYKLRDTGGVVELRTPDGTIITPLQALSNRVSRRLDEDGTLLVDSDGDLWFFDGARNGWTFHLSRYNDVEGLATNHIEPYARGFDAGIEEIIERYGIQS